MSVKGLFRVHRPCAVAMDRMGREATKLGQARSRDPMAHLAGAWVEAPQGLGMGFGKA